MWKTGAKAGQDPGDIMTIEVWSKQKVKTGSVARNKEGKISKDHVSGVHKQDPKGSPKSLKLQPH